MELLKFLTCGSVDDGKSTLIGHMLYAAKLIFADQKQALDLDSKVGSNDGNIDYSLLLDGLEAEREQGITIDVAYRFFSTEKRRFIVADTPGHVEYTRNMAVGASFADLAVILVDVNKGVLVQTRRHCRVCAMMGIRDFVFAVNKMDLCGYDEGQFRKVKTQITGLLEELMKDMDINVHTFSIIPVSATNGDNVVDYSSSMPWYDGEALLPYIESIDVYRQPADNGFVMPVQRVCRPNASFRGYQGEIQCGCARPGDKVEVLPSGEKAKISGILSAGSESIDAGVGEPVTLCLDREIDVSRGCVISSSSDSLYVGSTFTAEILWMNDLAMDENRRFKVQIGTGRVACTVVGIKYAIDADTWEHLNADSLSKNTIAVCDIHTDVPVVFEKFTGRQGVGGLILIDPVSNATAACGVVLKPVGVEGKPQAQALSITRQMRERQNGCKAKTVWFTGLSGSGKSTIADLLEKKLFGQGIRTMILDGDNVRMGLCRGLGFSLEGRKENIRRVAEAAKLLNDAGVVVLCSFISPLVADRRMARDIIGDESFVEVFVDTPLETCMERDVKGLYQKALWGEIREFTGVSSPYERPVAADVVVNTEHHSKEECRDIVFDAVWSNLTKVD